ncbi:hypothetical protein [Acinetobacter junii]|uniref:hypothetical protein n=1 Tax=Acinetobacter junii TaxID=40215 RepID=UPI00124F6824|nr:hypothetical protein [Acinetobacter junii]
MHGDEIKFLIIKLEFDKVLSGLISASTQSQMMDLMKVKRLVANLDTNDVYQDRLFYEGVLGLNMLMDHGWSRPTDQMQR